MTATVQGINGSDISKDLDGTYTISQRWKIFADANPLAIGGNESVILAKMATAINTGTPSAGGCGAVIGAAHPRFAAAICTGYSAHCVGAHKKAASTWEWEGVVEFKPDPMQLATKISVAEETTKQGVLYDVNGDALVNSADDPIPYEVDRCPTSFTVEKYFTTWDYRRCNDARVYPQGYNKSRNDATITITAAPWTNFSAPAGFLLIQSINVETLNIAGTCIAKVTFKVLHDHDQHQAMLLDQGFNYFNPDSDELKKIPFTDSGVPSAIPKLLDGTGFPLDVTLNDPETLPFQFFPTRDWSIFGAPFA